MVDRDAPVSKKAESKVVAEDEDRLEHLEEEIEEAEQHLRKATHADEPHFYNEGSEDEGSVPG
jgi:hypothetical protein